jgi:hypothetical protein
MMPKDHLEEADLATLEAGKAMWEQLDPEVRAIIGRMKTHHERDALWMGFITGVAISMMNMLGPRAAHGNLQSLLRGMGNAEAVSDALDEKMKKAAH